MKIISFIIMMYYWGSYRADWRSSLLPVSPGCQATYALYGHNTCNVTFDFRLVQSERDSMGMPSDVKIQNS